ncbi:MAG: tetratricopeptide repeat protein [Rhodothermales bacterium]
MHRLVILLLLVVGLGLLGCRSESSSVERPAALVPVPSPSLTPFEPAVQEQLRATRRTLDSLLTHEPATTVALGPAFGTMGRHYFAHDLVDAAAACFTNARRLQPEDVRWAYYLGALTQREGRLDEARVYLLEVIGLRADDLPSLLRLGQIALDQDSLATARHRFEQALAIDAGSAMALYGLGRVAAAEQAVEEAIDTFNRVLALQPEATAVHHPLGLMYRQRGDVAKARAHLDRAGNTPVRFDDPLMDDLATFVGGARVYIAEGNEARNKGEFERAVAAYRKALEIDPRNVIAHYNLGTLLGQLKADDEAMTYFRAAIELDPNHRDARFNLATALSRAGRFEEALHHFDRVLSLDAEDQQAHLRKALVLKTLDRISEAEAELEGILAVDPGHTEALVSLSTLLVEQGRVDEARSKLAQALSTALPPAQELQLRYVLSTALQKQGHHAEAIEELNRVVGLKPDFADAHFSLAGSLGMMSRYEEAVLHYTEAVRYQPDHVRAHLGRAMILIAHGGHEAARAAFEESIRMLPGDSTLRHALARLLATSPDAAVRDGARALELSRQVYQATRSLEHGATIAMALAELGRFDEAIAWQQQLINHARQSRVPGSFMQQLQQHLATYKNHLAVRM